MDVTLTEQDKHKETIYTQNTLRDSEPPQKKSTNTKTEYFTQIASPSLSYQTCCQPYETKLKNMIFFFIVLPNSIAINSL